MNLEQKRMAINEIKIDNDLLPDSNDYILGESYTVNYNLLPQPIFMFTKNSKIRKFGEKILQDYNLRKTHTLVFHKNNNWYSSFVLSKLDDYVDIFNL